MSDLTAQRCEPCEGGIAPLTRDEAQALMDQLNEDWSLSEDATEIRRDYHFKGFNKTMGFVNAVAWVANSENHHPDLEVGWGHCLVRTRPTPSAACRRTTSSARPRSTPC